MNVLWETKEGLTLSQIVRRAEERYLHSWKMRKAEQTINNIIKKGAAESYHTGNEVQYRAILQRDEYRLSLLSRMGNKVFRNAAFNYMAALTAEEELTDEEVKELQRMIDELDDTP